jgi:hypothetical protein
MDMVPVLIVLELHRLIIVDSNRSAMCFNIADILIHMTLKAMVIVCSPIAIVYTYYGVSCQENLPHSS